MSVQQNIFFLLETLFDDETRQISLRVNVRSSQDSKPKVITQETIIELLKQRGYAQYFRFDEIILTIINDLTQRLDALGKGNAVDKDVFETSAIAEARDATATVRIADDALEAFITLTPARGGNQLDLDSIKSILAEAEIKFGIDEQSLFNLLQQARQSETGEEIEMLVAMAKQPVDGEDTQFIPLVETANERILKPQLRPNGTIDMRELGNLPIVKADQKIMLKKIFTQGEAGTDVLGNVIESEPGEDFDFEMAPGSMINPENPCELIAEFNGQPNLQGKGMKVENVVKVKAVDLSTGNIDIDANLLVEGDITESMKVRCTGDITVGGVIESADVEAQGNIVVGKGIVGHIPKHQGENIELTTRVRAGKTINAIFASYSELEAGEEIHLDEQMLHCDSTSGGIITIGNPKTVGSQIVGGITRAQLTVKTDIVGSHAGILTRIDLSGPYQEKQQGITSIEHDIKKRNAQLDALRITYSKFTSLKMTPERKKQATKIKNTIVHLTKLVAQLETDSQKMREERDLALQQMQVQVKRRVHPLVEVLIGSRKFRSRRAMESGIISWLDGDVCYQAESLKKNK